MANYPALVPVLPDLTDASPATPDQHALDHTNERHEIIAVASDIVLARAIMGYGYTSLTSMIQGMEARLGGSAAAPSRLIVRGHSYASDRGATPYGNTHIWNSSGDHVHDSASFASLMRDLGGGGHRRYMEVNVPPTTATGDQTTVLGEIPEDCVIEGVWYIPAGDLTGANNNTRKVEIQSFSLFGMGTFGIRQYDSGLDMTLGVPHPIYSPLFAPTPVFGDVLRARNASAAPLSLPLYFPAYVYPLVGTSPVANVLLWKSTHVGTGLADPGGKVIVRLGGRYRNTAIDGAILGGAGVYGTGWGAALSQHKLPIAFGVEVCATAGSALNASPISCSNITAPIPSGWKIRFTNGALATTTGVTAIGATTISVGNHAAIVAGEQGFAAPGLSVDSYDTLTAEGVFAWMTGLNDVMTDRPFWRELVRSVIAFDCCPYISGAGSANHVTVAGGGAWDAFTQPAGGRWLVPTAAGGNASALRFTGTVSGSPSITIRTSPAFRGTTIDLFFAALAGTGRGARASIVIDGGAAKIIDTSGGFVGGGFNQLINAITLSTGNTSATATGTGFTSGLIGKYVEHPNIPRGVHIASVESSTSLTLSSGTGVTASSSVSGNVIDFAPMVKRLTGLTPGAHTVVITLTGIDATDKSAALIYLGYGFEVDTPVMWGNIPQIPSSGATQIVTDSNTDSVAVIAGTAAAVGTGTQEPALGPSVQLVDLNAVLNLDPTLFLGDGKHPNSRGVSAIVQAYSAKIRALTQSQLLAR